MSFEILSFHLINNFSWFLKCDRDKGNKEDFCDKDQNSCYDVGFSGALLH